MIVFKVINILFFLAIIIIASFYLIWSFIAAIQAKWVPYVPSYDEDLKRMKETLILKWWKTMIDLWCWDWKALRFFVKEFWIEKAVWFDFNVPAIIFGKILNRIHWLSDKIELHVWDFTKAKIWGYDYIYIYLLSEYMAKVEDIIFEKMDNNSAIISNTFKFKNHTPYEIKHNETWRDRILLYSKDWKLRINARLKK